MARADDVLEMSLAKKSNRHNPYCSRHVHALSSRDFTLFLYLCPQ